LQCFNGNGERERNRSLFYSKKISEESKMVSEEKKQLIESGLQQAIAGTDLFLVDLKFLPYDKIEVFLDADSAVQIQQCTSIARLLNKKIEEQFPDWNYELEVSSAGLEHPLKTLRQFKKNIGRKLEVHLHEGKLIEGKLIEADEKKIKIESTSAKAKHKKEEHTFLYDAVKEVFVGVSFK
jgi:ribosome maturation factor RimP